MEWGYGSLRDFMAAHPEVSSVAELQAWLSARFSAEIELLPYLSPKSAFSGGRAAMSPVRVRAEVDRLNADGVAASVVLNGGLSFGGAVEPAAVEVAVADLAWLADNSRRYGVDNAVTILNRDLHRRVKHDLPELKTIASCIMQLHPDVPGGFDSFFDDFDYIVPLNQQTSVSYLTPYRRFADRMILLLYVYCSSVDLHRCYLHYIRMESDQCTSVHVGHEILVRDQWLQRVPAHRRLLPTPPRGLTERPAELRQLAAMGFHRFKIPQTYGLDRAKLCELVEQLVAADLATSSPPATGLRGELPA